MQRTARKTSTPLTNGEGTIWNCSAPGPEGNHPSQAVFDDFGSITPFNEIRSDHHKYSLLSDVKSDGEWHYNDCSHEKLTASYGEVIDPVTRRPEFRYVNRQNRVTDDPSHYSLDTVCYVPCAKIIGDTSKAYGVRGTSMQYSHERVSQWFAEPYLPTGITINRDPWDTRFSIWFLIADLVQLPRLVKAIFNRSLIRRRDLFGNKTLKQLANTELMKEFGVIATYGDCAAFIGACKRFSDGVQALLVAQQKVYKWHADQLDLRVSIPDPTERVFDWSYLGFGNLAVVPKTHISRAVFTRTMAYRLKCPELLDWASRLKQLIDLFGVLDPAAAWDVLPFSFVVDWFLPVGRWLHKNKPRLFPAQFEVQDYCESIRLDQTVSWFVRCTMAPSPFTSHSVRAIVGPREDGDTDPAWSGALANIGEETVRTYVRRRFIPNVERMKPASVHPLLSIRQGLVASGLVAQRIPRPGTVWDSFEGANFGSPFPVNSPEAARELEANQRWAREIRQKAVEHRVNSGILMPKFENRLSRGNWRLPKAEKGFRLKKIHSRRSLGYWRNPVTNKMEELFMTNRRNEPYPIIEPVTLEREGHQGFPNP